ncbi:MAG: virulence protein RhuM/Fic/DOC family protein [Desulfobacterales bacterium]|jgi:prophage maintenance system killer protein|nr:virulence protein RhuM/Fic/DOC family protein [Desulfobacterales bacterium]
MTKDYQTIRSGDMQTDRGEIILYKSEGGDAEIAVQLRNETVWLTLNQITDLFERDKSVISRHLRNIFLEKELSRAAVVAKNATTAADGKTYQVEYYNLDAIISVGYRVNSKRGTQFRIWATGVLKDHLVRGYSLNQRRLAEKGTDEIRQVLDLLSNTLSGQNLVSGEGIAILEIVNHYARTWQLLLQYDEDTLPVPEKTADTKAFLEIAETRQAIVTLKKELASRGEATDIFGNEHGQGLAGIIGAVQQTFGGQDLYPSFREKAAHLLYFVIKDHPFSDGNKRIGSFLFLYFMNINGLLAEHGIDNKALVALSLLTAASDPRQKDLMIRLIVNLISEKG